MSKYIDKDKVLEYIIFGVVGKDITCGELTRAIESLPTIEVNEDCISREWLVNRFKDIVEHYEMRIKRVKRYGKKTTYDTSEQIGYWKDEITDCKYFIKEIENAPSVVPSRQKGIIGQGSGDIDWQAVTSTGQEIYAKGYEDGRKSVEVSEDAINGFKDGQKDMLIFLLEGMKNALEKARNERVEE